MMRRASSDGTCGSLTKLCAMPALLMAMSRRPKRLHGKRNQASPTALPRKCRRRAPRSRSAATPRVRSSGPASTSESTSRAPSAASRSQSRRPKPPVAPVTSAVSPSKRIHSQLSRRSIRPPARRAAPPRRHRPAPFRDWRRCRQALGGRRPGRSPRSGRTRRRGRRSSCRSGRCRGARNSARHSRAPKAGRAPARSMPPRPRELRKPVACGSRHCMHW